MVVQLRPERKSWVMTPRNRVRGQRILSPHGLELVKIGSRALLELSGIGYLVELDISI